MDGADEDGLAGKMEGGLDAEDRVEAKRFLGEESEYEDERVRKTEVMKWTKGSRGSGAQRLFQG